MYDLLLFYCFNSIFFQSLLFICLFGFYSISTFVGFFFNFIFFIQIEIFISNNLFLTVLIQFSISIVIVFTQLNVKGVLS